MCFGGVEKLYHQYFHHDEVNHKEPKKLIGQDESLTVETSEKVKNACAVRTDFVLSAEIIVITLGTVATEAFSKQVIVLVAIAIIMTIGVYGLVAGIVKLDDGGFIYLKLKAVTLLRNLNINSALPFKALLPT